MARYNIYQVQRLDICSTKEGYTYDVKLNVIAEYEITKPYKDSVMLAEDIWDACNVSCWKRDWEDSVVNEIVIPIENKMKEVYGK